MNGKKDRSWLINWNICI